MAPKKAKRKAQVRTVPSQRQSNNQKQETKISIRLDGVAKKGNRRYVARKARVAPAPASTIITNYSQPNPVMYTPSASPYPYPAPAAAPAPVPEPVPSPGSSISDLTYGSVSGGGTISTYRGFPAPLPYPPFGSSVPPLSYPVRVPRSIAESEREGRMVAMPRVPIFVDYPSRPPLSVPPIAPPPSLVTSPSITPDSSLITQPVSAPNSLRSTLASVGSSLLSSLVSEVKSGRVTAPSSGATVSTKQQSRSSGSSVSSMSGYDSVSTPNSDSTYSASSIYYDRAYKPPSSTIGKGDKNPLFQNRQYFGKDSMTIDSNKGYSTPVSSGNSSSGKKTMPVIIVPAPKTVSTVGSTSIIVPQTVDKPISPRSVLTSSSMTPSQGKVNVIPFEKVPAGRPMPPAPERESMPKRAGGRAYAGMSASGVQSIATDFNIELTKPGAKRGSLVRKTKAELIREIERL